ncbi:ABC transporter permease [uncultured Microbacterium sp.]|uniref:ABC transporter permease n=1 Tax=uncultured Microbacterium sp. TaxID=191216 RepID=UPI0035CADEF3
MTDVVNEASPRRQLARDDRPSVGHRLGGILERYGLLLLLVVMVAIFALAPESGEAFRSAPNIRAILANQAVGFVVAIALLFPFTAGFFDFSVGATTAASSVVAATALSKFGLPLIGAVALAIGFGLLVGAAVGYLVAFLQMNAFIATLGMATLLGGVIFAYTEGLQITSGIPTELTDIGSKDWFGVPQIVVVAAIVAVVAWFVLTQTVTGRRLIAAGSNPRATTLLGLSLRRIQFGAFLTSGLFGGIAGVLLLARQGAATSDGGMSMLFPALTAVLLSTIVIHIGRASVPGTIIGILFIAVSVSGLTLIGAPAWVGPVFNGAALLLAVGFARLTRRPRAG